MAVGLLGGTSNTGGPMLILSLLACSCGGRPAAADSAHTGATFATGPGLPGTTVYAEVDASNTYSATASITLGRIELAQQQDFTIDLCGLTTDLRGRPLSEVPAQQLLLLEFDLPAAEVVAGIADNAILNNFVSAAWFDAIPADRCASPASELSSIGAYLDPELFVPVATGGPDTWLLALVNLDRYRLDVLQLVELVPTASSDVTVAELTDDISTLDVDLDLLSVEPLHFSAGRPQLALDWSELPHDVFGDPIDPFRGDRLTIGHVPSTDLAWIEANLPALDLALDAEYTLDVHGQLSADLSLATDADGGGFPGFDTAGTWLIALECSQCLGPLPLWLTRVEVGP